MTESEIVKIILSNINIDEVVRDNPEIKREDVTRILEKIRDTFCSVDGKVFYMHVDGASRGNPGDSGIGVVIKDRDKRTVEEYCEYIGQYTNNVAEYMALICGLQKAKKYNPGQLKIFSDSQLMVQQVSGVWKVKDAKLIQLYENARRLLNGFSSWEINAVPRSENKTADALANMGIDKYKK